MSTTAGSPPFDLWQVDGLEAEGCKTRNNWRFNRSCDGRDMNGLLTAKQRIYEYLS